MKRLLMLLLSVLPWFGPLAAERTLWKNIPVGPAANAVHAIAMDDNGLIWIGTDNGLFGYDGYKTYRYGTGGDLSECQIHGIVCHDGMLCLGTSNGLRLFNPSSGDTLRTADGSDLSEIRALIRIDQQLWIGSLSGLYRYDLATSTLHTVQAALPHPAVYALLHDRDMLYIGTYHGLCRYDLRSGKLERMTLRYGGSDRSSIFVNSLALDRPHDTLHVGTEGSLLTYDLAADKVVDERLRGNSIKALRLCDDGLVAGTDNGLYRIRHDRTERCRHDSRRSNSIANNVVWSVFSDPDGNLIAGTDSGISIAGTTTGLNILPLDDLTGRSDGNQIASILRTSDGALWLGGPNGVIRTTGGSSEWFLPGEGDNGLSHNRIRDIFQDRDGSVWVATDGGLNRFDARHRRFENFHIENAEGTLNANWCYSIAQDAEGLLWVGSYLGGIMAVNPAMMLRAGPCRALRTVNTDSGLPNNLVSRLEIDSHGRKWVLFFRHNALLRIDGSEIRQLDIEHLTGNQPDALYLAPDETVWVGAGDKLVRVPQEMEQPQVYRLPPSGEENDHDDIVALQQVGSDLWIVTTTDVWILDTASGEIDLLPTPDRTYSAIYLDPSDGCVLLGATDELIRIDPAWLVADARGKEVRIMRILIDGEVAATPFASGIELPRIALKSEADKLEIELSALDYNPSKGYRYAYCIPGITDGYVVLPSQENTLSVPHLGPGRYDLRIKHCVAEASPIGLHLRVPAPWYARWYSLVCYALLVCGGIAITLRLARQRDIKRMEENERDRTLASIRHKMDFLTNISHELKTPLSLILGPISRLRETVTDREVRHALEGIYINTLKIDEMVHKTIEVDRVDLETEAPVIRSRMNVTEFCKSIFDSYAEAYPTRHFNFSAQESLMAEWDAVKMESVLNNLLSNACKYSADDATIGCSLRRIFNAIEIRISDNGIGIPADEQHLIFQRLFRSSRTTGLNNGSGIGLYLVKRYVEMHRGEVGVESREGEGTTFTVTIPCDDTKVPPPTPIPRRNPERTADRNRNRPRILIVEDNLAIAEHIGEILADGYECKTASNGRAALSLLTLFRPNLIITDEMMPVMSGLEMSRRIKSMPAFASVPIIMVTAKSDNSTETRAAQYGIDTFVSKPFEAPLLRALVEQRLQAAQTVRESLRIEQLTHVEPIVAESGDERLLEVVTRTIEEHIDDTLLSVTLLCEKTGVSSKQLGRTIKRYAGVTPVEYIRQIRMKKAVLLLSQRKFTIAEIAYMVGFGSPSYFTKCFIAQYGCRPSEYTENGNSETVA